MSTSRELISSTTEETTETVKEDARNVMYRVTYEIRVFRVTRVVRYEETVEPNPEHLRLLRIRRAYRGWISRYKAELSEVSRRIKYLEARRRRYPPISAVESVYISRELDRLWSEWGALMREIQLERYEVEEINRRLRETPSEIVTRIPMVEEFEEEERVEVERKKLFKRVQCAWVWMYQRGKEYITYQLKGIIFTNYAELSHEPVIHRIVTSHKDEWVERMSNPWTHRGYGHYPIEGPNHSSEEEEVEEDEVVGSVGELDVSILCEDTGWSESIAVVKEEDLY